MISLTRDCSDPLYTTAGHNEEAERRKMSRKVIVWNMVTLDGYFEGTKPWEIDWHEYVWGEELERFSLDQAREVGTLLFGRKTYEGMLDYWSTATGEVAEFMNSIPKVVFSNTLETAEWSNTRLVKGSA